MNEPRRQYGVASADGVAIDQGLRQYMLGVYNYMALGVAATGVFSMLLAGNRELMMLIGGTPLKFVILAGVIGLGWFSPRILSTGSKITAHAMFWTYAALWGLLIAPMLFSFQMAGAAQEIYRAFFITASAFGGLSLWGYTTKKDLTGWAPYLMAGGLGLLIAMVVGFIFGGTLFSLLFSCAAIIFTLALTAYETQMIKSMYQEGGSMNDRAAIFGAFALYGSFIMLFIHILNILGIMRSE